MKQCFLFITLVINDYKINRVCNQIKNLLEYVPRNTTHIHIVMDV